MLGQAAVTIRDRQWQVSIAQTPWELMQGMGGLLEILPRTGMLFDTGLMQTIQVTTVPMLFPIDIAFLSETLVVTEVYRNVEPGCTVTSISPARYFLEVNAGEFEGIDSGDQALVEFLPAPLMIPAEADWMSAMVRFVGFAIMAVFIVAIARAFVKAAMAPPKRKPVLHDPRHEAIAYELLENPEFWLNVYRIKDLTGLSLDEAFRVVFVLRDQEFLAKARAFYEEMRYPPRAALENIEAIEEAIGGGNSLMPKTERRIWYLGEWWEEEYSTANAVVYRSADRRKRLYVRRDGTLEVKPAPADEELCKTAVIPTEPRPRRPREELEFLPDSPEVIAQTIDAIGYRQQIDTAFLEAIRRAKGLV